MFNLGYLTNNTKERNLLLLITWNCRPTSDKHNAVSDFAFARYHTWFSVICFDVIMKIIRFFWNLYLDPKFNEMFDFSTCGICNYTHIFWLLSFKSLWILLFMSDIGRVISKTNKYVVQNSHYSLFQVGKSVNVCSNTRKDFLNSRKLLCFTY